MSGARSECPFLDLVLQTPRPRGRDRSRFGETWGCAIRVPSHIAVASRDLGHQAEPKLSNKLIWTRAKAYPRSGGGGLSGSRYATNSFSAISMGFSSDSRRIQSISIEFLSFSISFSQLQSVLINFNQFQSV